MNIKILIINKKKIYKLIKRIKLELCQMNINLEIFNMMILKKFTNNN